MRQKEEYVYIVGMKKYKWSISLAPYIFVYTHCSNNTLKHELGHNKQSLFLGWFYLLVVGIPSFIFATLTLLDIIDYRKYYDRFPENWADKLGKVNR